MVTARVGGERVRRLAALVLALIALSTAALPVQAADLGWTTYVNARFGTRIEYPAGLFEMVLPPPVNDDGRRFAARDGSAAFVASGIYNVLDETIGDHMDAAISAAGPGGVIYQRLGPDWYVLSGFRGTDIWYRKVLFSAGGEIIHTFEITYPAAARATYDPVTARMSGSFSAVAGPAISR